MSKRFCITTAEIEAPRHEIVVVAWPWSNSPSDLNPQMSQAVSNAVGGLPVVLLAASARGLHSFGSAEHTAAAIWLDFQSASWRLIDVDDPALEALRQAA